MLDIDNQTSIDIDLSKLEYIYKRLLKEENREEKDVSLLLLEKGQIRYYNKKFRGKDSETDVISFASDLAFLPTYGDIVIDLSVADKQRGNESLDYEVMVLFMHGLLHLLGYDHLSVNDKEIMDSKEKEYISLFKKEIL
ncbi:rRNA maturation RNase YbeY [bacterium]|nr:rRNA maturation RNase YbeY [bacterium]